MIIVISSSFSSSLSSLKNNNSNHLVVLAHGIMGTSNDLGYLANLLREKGCIVLCSSVNERTESLNGIDIGGKKLALEIVNIIDKMPSINEISFVGNSLGGLYSRFAIKELDNNSKLNNIKRKYFMSIATPHLGVLNYTYIEQALDISIPVQIKELVASTMLRSGKHVFLADRENGKLSQSLLYKMATSDIYLNPLKAFSKRRLYANLVNDFVVPCEISSLLSHDECTNLRRKNQFTSGIVAVLSENNRAAINSDIDSFHYMLSSLDNIGWSKVIVNFPGVLPIAHNKICALQRFPLFFYDKLMGTSEGKHVMNDAAAFLLQ